MSKFNAAMIGATLCNVFAYPCAVLIALLWRFPIPMSGYASGPSAVEPALMAVMIYQLLGGALLLGIFGAVAGIAAHDFRYPDDGAITRLAAINAFVIALLATGLMSMARF